MRHYLLLVLIVATAANAYAQPVDMIGGADGAQTVHHCGYAAMQSGVYTDSAVTTRIVQEKLQGLGFYRGALDGKNSKLMKQAVRRYQADAGLKADGVVGPMTAQYLAFTTYAYPNMRQCWRQAQL